MQEPYGAFSWYAVNDQPSDKALYDFTITVPAPMVGVANGELLSRKRRRAATPSPAGGSTSRPRRTSSRSRSATSTMTEDESRLRRPDHLLDPARTSPSCCARLREAPAGAGVGRGATRAVPVRHASGFLVVDSAERHGDPDDDHARRHRSTPPRRRCSSTRWRTTGTATRSRPVDWRDVWMNEGMATYLQGVWTAEDAGTPLESIIDSWADVRRRAARGRRPAGRLRPGRVRRRQRLLQRRGDVGRDAQAARRRRVLAAGARVAGGARQRQRRLRRHHRRGGRSESGEDLSELFDDWLLGETTPDAPS